MSGRVPYKLENGIYTCILKARISLKLLIHMNLPFVRYSIEKSYRSLLELGLTLMDKASNIALKNF